MRNDQPVRLFDNRRCALGEGGLWHPLGQQFFWFDILGQRLLSRQGDQPLEWRFDWQASAAGWMDAGTLMIATESGLRRFDIASGAHEPLAALGPEDPAIRPNDGRADPQGGFWIGTMARDAAPGAGAIWRWYRGRVPPVFTGLTIPNAICFAPDGRRAWFADTPRQQIMTVALDAEGWPDGAPEVFVDLRAAGLYPDGAVVDAAGGLWNAQWGAGRVVRYTPGGQPERVIRVPGLQASCPAFGGPDLTQILITAASTGLDDHDPDPGLAGTGCQGQAEGVLA